MKSDTKSSPTPSLQNTSLPPLIIGIGNSGRTDDGLGWALLDALSETGNYNGELVYRYQLQVEDAELISHYDRVLFVDASYTELERGFQWRPVKPEIKRSFTTHALEPSTILGLCHEIYGCRPDTSILMIQGTNWELSNGLSEDGIINLQSALDFISTLQSYSPS